MTGKLPEPPGVGGATAGVRLVQHTIPGEYLVRPVVRKSKSTHEFQHWQRLISIWRILSYLFIKLIRIFLRQMQHRNTLQLKKIVSILGF